MEQNTTDTDALIIRMLERGWVSKEQLMITLSLSERAVRDYIAGLNERLAPYGKCVLSTAAHKGYKIPDPRKAEDRQLMEGAVAELKSKAISIFERRKVIEDSLNAINETPVQMTLF